MKNAKELFFEHEGNLIHKWDHYFDIYDRYFSKYRGQAINMLEIGISHMEDHWNYGGNILEKARRYLQ